MVSNSRPYSTVEVKPQRSVSPPTMAPSSPPKSVRFAPCIKSEARKLTPTEAWSLYYFEVHARACSECYDPAEVVKDRRSLCSVGHSLALDVAEHVYQSESHVYSTHKDNHKHVRVEVPKDYTHVRQLLKCMDRALRTYHRTVPIISYDRTYPISPRRASDREERRPEVIVEPASAVRRSKHKTSKYPSVEILDDTDAFAVKPRDYKDRRGSLYETDLTSRRKASYRVEVREPEREERRRRRRDSGYYN